MTSSKGLSALLDGGNNSNNAAAELAVRRMRAQCISTLFIYSNDEVLSFVGNI